MKAMHHIAPTAVHGYTVRSCSHSNGPAQLSIVRLAVAAALLVLVGCGEQAQSIVEFGKAPAGRRAEFASAVATALRGFEDLDSQSVQIVVSNVVEASTSQVLVHGGRLDSETLGKALGVALTNISFKYPGIGFMATEDGGWRILMPDEMMIPATGDFGLEVR